MHICSSIYDTLHSGIMIPRLSFEICNDTHNTYYISDPSQNFCQSWFFTLFLQFHEYPHDWLQFAVNNLPNHCLQILRRSWRVNGSLNSCWLFTLHWFRLRDCILSLLRLLLRSFLRKRHRTPDFLLREDILILMSCPRMQDQFQGGNTRDLERVLSVMVST